MGYDYEEPKTSWDDNTRLEKLHKANKALGGKSYTLDDTGNATAFIDYFGQNARFDCKNKVWMIYDDGTWRVDGKQKIRKAVDGFIEQYRNKLKEIVLNQDDGGMDNTGLITAMKKNISRMANSAGKDALLKEAQHIGATPVDPTEFDTVPFLLNCENGVIDLRTGYMCDHDPKLMMAKNTNIPVDMEHEPTRFIKFLSEIFGGNQAMVDYMQVIIGYTLTGEVKEQCMFQCVGNGGNGKSVLMDVMSDIIGDYGLNTKVESILTKGSSSGGSASPDIARMNGVRFIRTNEPDEGSKLNEGFVKQLVGGDIITARNLYGLDFEFKPCGKLWVSTNYKLVIRGTDKGIWRRQQLISFKQTFEGSKADKSLPYKLQAEYPQILGWAVKGAMKWYKEGIKQPVYVIDDTKEYKVEMDVVANFLRECTKINPKAKEKSGDLYKAYMNWCREGKEYCMSATKFGLEMKKRYQKKTINGYGYYMGIVLKENDTSYTYIKED